jgi:flagellar hook-associated protein 1
MIFGQLFSIGGSALQASQLALQVTGNNLANAATPGYSRQSVDLSPARPQNLGRFQVGTGVRVKDIRRMVDEQLNARLREAVSNEALAQDVAAGLSGVESMLNELSGSDLSSELTKFFSAWSERANLTQTSAVVVQQGERLAGFISRLRGDLTDLQKQGDSQIGALIGRVNTVLGQLEKVNLSVAESEATGGTASGLRDQRDTLLRELAEYMDISTVEQPNGSIDVLVGSYPILLNGKPKPLMLEKESTPQGTRVSIMAGDDADCEHKLTITGGRLGAALAGRSDTLGGTIEQLDQIASELIFQMNRLHGTGANLKNLSTTTGTLRLAPGDQAKALNDPTNLSLTGLAHRPRNGGFDVNVTNPLTGQTVTTRIDLDLDGLKIDGSAGTDDDTSLADLVASIDAIEGVKASITSDGRLKVDAEAGFEFSFADDTSDAVAVLGLNAFFTGQSASDIDVNAPLKTNPSQLMVGRMVNGSLVENATALAAAQVQDLDIESLGGRSIRETWIDTVQGMGGEADAANARAESASLVRENLDAQVAAISGVSVDEESINMIGYQRLYQAAARYIQTMDEVTQTLISIV